MPHLHDGESSDNDDASRGSECSASKSVGSNSPNDCLSHDKATEESAANKLLSLANLAEEHAKSRSDTSEKNESNEKQGEDGREHPPSPPPHSSRQPSEDERPLPHLVPGMVHNRWGAMNHPAQYPPHVFYRQGPMGHMRPMYPSPVMGAPPGGNPGAGDLMRRGGFPMWTNPPCPPYQPHMRGATPSPLPPAFRGPIPQQFMTRQQSANDDDNSVNSERRRAPKRVSLGPAPKSILKKPRLDTETSLDKEAGEVDEEKEEEGVTRPSDGPSVVVVVVSSASDATEEANADSQSETSHKSSIKSNIDSVVVKKEPSSSEDMATKKQRIISPASSNESPRCDRDEGLAYSDDSLSPHLQYHQSYSDMPTASPNYPFQGGAPFRMGHHYPPMHMYPGIHRPGRPFVPTSPVYPHRGMRPFPPPGAVSGMYPPQHRSMSARGRPGFVGIPPFFARRRLDAASPTSSSALEQQCEDQLMENVQRVAGPPSPVVGGSDNPSRNSPSVRSLVHAAEAMSDVSGNANRCVPVTPPIPSKYWSDSDTTKDAILPDFHRLVNFPDLLIKGRNGGNEAGNDRGSPNPLGGKKRCVMCGELRVSATYVRAKKAGADNDGDERNSTSSPSSVSGTNGNDHVSGPSSSSAHIIPRQNKGVCTACDVTVWVALELDGMEIKWCKGCKNFRPWAAFGNKGTATKCVRCRDRQKEKYAMQKSASRRRSSGIEEKAVADDEDDVMLPPTEEEGGNNAHHHHCSLAVVAANGLRNLMNAR